jgi:hypothetical protein
MENYALLTIFAPQPVYAKNKSQTLGMVGTMFDTYGRRGRWINLL